jgi:hypothetical protein
MRITPARALLAMLCVLLVTACERTRPVERAGAAIDRAGSRTGEALGRAAENTGAALNRAGEWVRDRTN